MIYIDLISTTTQQVLWSGYVPCAPQIGAILSHVIPATPDQERSSEPFQVVGVEMVLLAETNIAVGNATTCGTVRVYAQQVSAKSNIITPGTIH